MKIETLKQLIENEYKSSIDKKEFRKRIRTLIDLFEKDQDISQLWEHPIGFSPFTTTTTGDEQVPYNTICSCNPSNGGSGICGCTMANQMVDKNN